MAKQNGAIVSVANMTDLGFLLGEALAEVLFRSPVSMAKLLNDARDVYADGETSNTSSAATHSWNESENYGGGNGYTSKGNFKFTGTGLNASILGATGFTGSSSASGQFNSSSGKGKGSEKYTGKSSFSLSATQTTITAAEIGYSETFNATYYGEPDRYKASGKFSWQGKAVLGSDYSVVSMQVSQASFSDSWSGVYDGKYSGNYKFSIKGNLQGDGGLNWYDGSRIEDWDILDFDAADDWGFESVWGTISSLNVTYSDKDDGDSLSASIKLASPVTLDKVTIGSGAAALDVAFNQIMQQILSGDDKITGNSKDGNVLYGFAGNDTLIGNTGSDILVGGKGADTLKGGKGSDYFVFAAGDSGSKEGGFARADLDLVQDFKLSEGDKLVFDFTTAVSLNDSNVSIVLGKSAAAGNYDALKQAATSALAGGDRIYVGYSNDDKKTGYLFADLDGDRSIDVAVRLTGITSNDKIDASAFEILAGLGW